MISQAEMTEIQDILTTKEKAVVLTEAAVAEPAETVRILVISGQVLPGIGSETK